MFIFYNILVFIHVASAILGLGPGFIMIYIVTKATNMTELRHAYVIRNRVHIFVMIGGSLLLLTGLLMGSINTALFHLGWYVISLTLFLIALGFGPIFLTPRSKPIKQILAGHQGTEIPKEYFTLAKKLFFYERMENVLFLLIIGIMIWKPLFLNSLIFW